MCSELALQSTGWRRSSIKNDHGSAGSQISGTKLMPASHRELQPPAAGSERVGRSEATGDRLEEAKHINRSLSALGDVMAALAA